MKVSAVSNYPLDLIKKYSKFIKGYHLSDNDGLEDTNNLSIVRLVYTILEKLDYVSVEVYDKLEVLKTVGLKQKGTLSNS